MALGGTLLPRRLDLEAHDRARPLRAGRLSARRRRRQQDGTHARSDARAHQGLGPAAREGARARDARRSAHADHLRRSARADRGAPQGRPQDGDHVVVAERDRRADRRIPRRRRRDRDARPARRATAATPASSSSTRTGRTRPTRSARWRSPKGIDLAASYAYSDSITDLPMLELVGNPVAVNPDRELARVAREREWDMRCFQRSGAAARPRAGAAEGSDARGRRRRGRGRHRGRRLRVAAQARRADLSASRTSEK